MIIPYDQKEAIFFQNYYLAIGKLKMRIWDKSQLGGTNG